MRKRCKTVNSVLLDEMRAELRAAREADAANGFDVVLRIALGDPESGDPLAVDLDALASQLLDRLSVGSQLSPPSRQVGQR